MRYEFKELTLTKRESEKISKDLNNMLRSFFIGFFFFVTVPYYFYKQLHRSS